MSSRAQHTARRKYLTNLINDLKAEQKKSVNKANKAATADEMILWYQRADRLGMKVFNCMELRAAL